VNNEDDYSTQMSEIEKQITELDPADEKYQVKLAQLVQKSNRIQHEKTLSAASQIFKQELDERDIKSTQRAFLEANPTFNTPEIQTRIKDMMANDKTGILDPVAAFSRFNAMMQCWQPELPLSKSQRLLKDWNWQKEKGKQGRL